MNHKSLDFILLLSILFIFFSCNTQNKEEVDMDNIIMSSDDLTDIVKR